ncbi:hypothetical protein HANVADRAFT_53828 [Hanseniaspora valbyensis NRRL Y-1626]|uniref:Membrane magnesium transporter n=1 Tax=Hanseniaspora valbyensis NRRL Y-1626 TaxID=766949 RepID=A0A1B7TA19_9ASCO|nr:hypothetical protein HANVADRAFT_53828 [Hanseniaspora valbyensis NRRL Y-1626]
MSILSKALLLVGILQLIHAGYSLHEFNRILKLSPAAALHLSLPADVKLEVFSGMIISIISILFSFNKIEYIALKDTENKIATLNQRLLPIKANLSNGVLNSSKFTEDYNTPHFFSFNLGEKKKK